MSKRIYAFSANAGGFSAEVRRPKDILIETQAASALGTIAGLSSAKAGRSEYHKKAVCFDKAYSWCEGDFLPAKEVARFTESNHASNNLPAVTRVAAGVSGVVIVNAKEKKAPRRTVTIKKACFRMDSLDPRKGGNATEFRFDPKETRLDGVSIDGCPLKITLATELFNEFPTLDALKTAWQGDPDFSEKYGHLFEPAGECHGREFPANENGVVLATVVHKIEWANPKKQAAEVTFEGANRVWIEGWGRLFLGELILTPKRRRVSMFRADVGSEYGGYAEGGFGEGGSEYP